jgi:hypothetical protein
MMTSVLIKLLKETFMTLLGRLTFQVLVERFATRLVVYGLEKIQAQATNDVTKDTVQDVLNQLQGKKLKVIEGLGVK